MSKFLAFNKKGECVSIVDEKVFLNTTYAEAPKGANKRNFTNYVIRDDGTVEEKSKKEIEQEAVAGLLAGIKERRNALLARSDWTQLADVALSNEAGVEWTQYRAKLRAIADGITTAKEADAVVFPDEPA